MKQPSAEAISEAQARELDRLLAVVARLVVDAEDQICCHDITMSEFRALSLLADDSLPAVHGLIEALGLSKSGATRVVDRLEAKGYARRVEGLRDDARVKGVRLTARGKALLQTIADEALPQRRALLEGIAVEHRQIVLDGLRVLAGAARRCC